MKIVKLVGLLVGWLVGLLGCLVGVVAIPDLYSAVFLSGFSGWNHHKRDSKNPGSTSGSSFGQMVEACLLVPRSADLDWTFWMEPRFSLNLRQIREMPNARIKDFPEQI